MTTQTMPKDTQEQRIGFFVKTILGIIVCGILFFVLYQFRGIAFGPRIQFHEINTSYIHTTDSVLIFNGIAPFAQEVSVLGNNLMITPEGNFKYTTPIPPGYSQITFSAINKYGKKSTKTFSIYFDHPPDTYAILEQAVQEQASWDEALSPNENESFLSLDDGASEIY